MVSDDVIRAWSTEVAINCPACGQRLLVRTNKETQQDFLGCSEWPECEHTETLPHDIRMRRAGAPLLPGFE